MTLNNGATIIIIAHRRQLRHRECGGAERRRDHRRRQRVGHDQHGHRRQLRESRGQPAAAATAITDTIDATTVSLTGSASVAEGAQRFIHRSACTSPADTAVTVTRGLQRQRASTAPTTQAWPRSRSRPAASSCDLQHCRPSTTRWPKAPRASRSTPARPAAATLEKFLVHAGGGASSATTGIVDDDISDREPDAPRRASPRPAAPSSTPPTLTQAPRRR